MSKTLDNLNIAKKARNGLILSHIKDNITVASDETKAANHAFAALSILLIIVLIASVGLNYFFFNGLNKLAHDKDGLSLKLNEISNNSEILSKQIDKQSDELIKLKQLIKEQIKQLESFAKNVEAEISGTKTLRSEIKETREKIADIEEGDKKQNAAIEGLKTNQQEILSKSMATYEMQND